MTKYIIGRSILITLLFLVSAGKNISVMPCRLQKNSKHLNVWSLIIDCILFLVCLYDCFDELALCQNLKLGEGRSDSDIIYKSSMLFLIISKLEVYH